MFGQYKLKDHHVQGTALLGRDVGVNVAEGVLDDGREVDGRPVGSTELGLEVGS